MKVTKTDFKDLLVLEPDVYRDDRGFFFESFNQKSLRENSIGYDFIQDNQSFSKQGVLRGLHFQHNPYAQTKLVRVLSGRIQDVVVDLRVEEVTYRRHFSIELSADNKKQLLVPKGFAHGFLVLTEVAEVLYKCDEFYHPDAEGGIIFNDPGLGIQWMLPESKLILSRKDLELRPLSN